MNFCQDIESLGKYLPLKNCAELLFLDGNAHSQVLATAVFFIVTLLTDFYAFAGAAELGVL